MAKNSSFKVGDVVVMIGVEERFGDTREFEQWREEQTPLTVMKSESERVKVEERPSYTISPNNLRYYDKKKAEKIKKEREQKEKKDWERVSELINQAKQAFRVYQDKGHNGNAYHIRVGEELKLLTGPCHGFIRNAGGPKSAAIVTLLVRSFESRKQPDMPVMERYYDFIFNRSPWASCFVDKDAKQCLEDKCVTLSVEAPANLLQGALMTTRHTWEMKDRVILWDKMVKQGVDERIAFIAMNFASVSGDEVVFTHHDSDHSPVDCRKVTDTGVGLFMTEPRKKDLNPPYNQGGSYEGVKAMWQVRGKTLCEDFERAFEAWNTRKKSSAVVNPFEKAKQKTHQRACMSAVEYAAFTTDFFSKLIKA